MAIIDKQLNDMNKKLHTLIHGTETETPEILQLKKEILQRTQDIINNKIQITKKQTIKQLVQEGLNQNLTTKQIATKHDIKLGSVRWYKCQLNKKTN